MRVSGRSTKADTERTSERGLYHPGVRARMPCRVASPSTDRTRRRPTDQWRAHDNQNRGEPSRHDVGEVVQSCCGPTEPGVPRRAVADHRVERVDRPIDQCPRSAADRSPQQRGDLCVGSVLGQRFQRRASQPVGVERGGSRPHSDGSSRLAASTSSASSVSAMSDTARSSEVPPSAIHVAESDADPAGNTLDRHTQKRHSAQQYADVSDTGPPCVAIRQSVPAQRRRAERGHRVTTMRIGKRQVRQPAGAQPDGSAPKHFGSVSHRDVLPS